MLSVRHLRKRFGPVEAVADVSLEIPRGCFFGLLGPNGAGKTTTISMIVGILEPDEGEVLVDDRRGPAIKPLVGYVPQHLALYDELSALDNLRFFGGLYGLSPDVLQTRVEHALDIVGLRDRARERVDTYSGGMKRRLNLAVALLHEPALLVLDEPTVGIDPQSRNAIFESLQKLRDEGLTLLYTTHYMEEVERLCDRIAVMDHGRVIAQGSLADLHRVLPARNVVTVELENSGSNGESGTTIRLELDDIGQDLPEALRGLTAQGARVREVHSHRASLEEVFLHLTGRGLRD